MWATMYLNNLTISRLNIVATAQYMIRITPEITPKNTNVHIGR